MPLHQRFPSLFAALTGTVSLVMPFASAHEHEQSLPWLARLSGFAQKTTDGRFGFHVKPLGQPPTLDFQADQVFEPASAIKTLIHVHVMLLVQHGEASLDEPIVVYAQQAGSCPTDQSPRVVSLYEALRKTMQESDNAATQALRSRFTDDAILATGTKLGLPSTRLRHRIGCAESAYENPNQTTLVDLASMYETIMSGLFEPETLATTLSLMNTSAGPAVPEPLREIIREEADALALDARLAETVLASTRVTQKSGNYDWRVGIQEYHHRAHAGVLTISFKSPRGESTPASFAFGAFVNDASNELAADTAATTLFWESLRPTIQKAVRSWASADRRSPADLDDALGSRQADGAVDEHDLVSYLELFAAGDLLADLDNASGAGIPDGQVSIDDLLFFIDEYEKARFSGLSTY